MEQLATANEILSELLRLYPWVTFKLLPAAKEIEKVLISTFSDATFNQTTSRGYEKTGILTELRIEVKNGINIFHPIDWATTKKHRISYHPYVAGILACAYGDDRSFYFKSGFNSLFSITVTECELFMDYRCLYDTITTLKEGKGFRLRPTVQRMRNSFDLQELDYTKWLPGTSNHAGALTKRNPNTSKIISELVSSGVMCIDRQSGYSRV